MKAKNTIEIIEYICIAGLILIQYFFVDIWVLVPLFSIIIIKLYNSRLKYKEVNSGKRKLIKTILKPIYHLVNFQSKDDVRCTFHIVVNNKFKQYINYINSDWGEGRIRPLDQGIIGKCYSSRNIEYVNFANEGEYKSRMVEEFNFVITGDQNPRADRRSYFSYPVLDGHFNIYGIVYMDSKKTNLFSKGTPKTETIINYLDTIKNDIIDTKI